MPLHTSIGRPFYRKKCCEARREQPQQPPPTASAAALENAIALPARTRACQGYNLSARAHNIFSYHPLCLRCSTCTLLMHLCKQPAPHILHIIGHRRHRCQFSKQRFGLRESPQLLIQAAMRSNIGGNCCLWLCI